MVAFSVFAGHRMANMCLRVAKMTWFPFGRLLIPSSSLVVRAINPGLLPFPLILGVVMIEIIGSVVWVRIAGSYYGILAWACCTVLRL